MAHKSDNAEIEKRVNKVYSLILQCHSSEKIIAYANQNWRINRAQAKNYIRRARTQMKEVCAIEREEAYAEEMELRREIIRKAMEDKKYGLALQAADSRAKLRGLFDKLEQAIDTVTAHGYEVSDPTEITETQGEDKPESS